MIPAKLFAISGVNIYHTATLKCSVIHFHYISLRAFLPYIKASAEGRFSARCPIETDGPSLH